MDENFDLPVTYKGEELLLNARLVQWGYTHRFLVDLYGLEVAFEPDEERNYRAIIDTNALESNRNIKIDLLKEIASTIETLFR